ncbi:hypothetical protein K7957_08225 [Sphingomonas yunnanensis]|uniref:hypothetical protein n=1 Tax=Sphingomonas yunnanensis TaxID=310400 RepID=UPI001CA63475|nr:hypothetical protein [Sphingomonas yunnanensis]MBY9062915.1 hypothetical protein [Sphingomonas yunnanensis]
MARDNDGRTAPTTGLVRRTTIELGPLRITREVALTTLPGTLAPTLPALRRRPRIWPALLAAAAATSLGGLAVAATKLPPRPSYSVSVPVPERVAVAAPRATPARTPRLTHRTERAATPIATSADEAAAELPGATSRAAAVAAALCSGEMTEWQQPGGAHGFVVAGAAEADGTRTCRALSVLTRSGGGDRVEQLRACLPGDGAAG